MLSWETFVKEEKRPFVSRRGETWESVKSFQKWNAQRQGNRETLTQEEEERIQKLYKSYENPRKQNR